MFWREGEDGMNLQVLLLIHLKNKAGRTNTRQETPVCVCVCSLTKHLDVTIHACCERSSCFANFIITINPDRILERDNIITEVSRDDTDTLCNGIDVV